MKRISLILWVLFGCVCVGQLGAIAYQIMSYERVLKEGEVFYFNVLPADPYDAFRGRYVMLRFENANSARLAKDEIAEEKSKGYAILAHQEKGDVIKEIRFKKPVHGEFLEVNVYSMAYIRQDDSHSVYFSLPFERFYMREDIAPKAEKVLRDRSGVKVKAKLRVLNGKGVIEELMVGEVPLKEYVSH